MKARARARSPPPRACVYERKEGEVVCVESEGVKVDSKKFALQYTHTHTHTHTPMILTKKNIYAISKYYIYSI